MKIEILFPEYCNLFGDLGNMMYLKACMPEALSLIHISEPTRP